jgi:hypothetical protein
MSNNIEWCGTMCRVKAVKTEELYLKRMMIRVAGKIHKQRMDGTA